MIEDDIPPEELYASSVRVYVIRAVNKCIAARILDPVQACNATITPKGEIRCGQLETCEEDLRQAFEALQRGGIVHESLEYEDVFNGIVSRGEVLH